MLTCCTSTTSAIEVSTDSCQLVSIVEKNLRLSYSQCKLICEILNQQFHQVDKIIKTGININFLDNENDTPLSHAIYTRELPIIRSLLDAKADLHLGTPLITAVRVESMEIVECLLQTREKAEETACTANAPCLLREHDAFGQTPLIWAVAYRNIHLVALLLQKKARVNDQDHNGNTALIHATKIQGPQETLSLLLQAGANMQTCNKRGRHAFFYATAHKNRLACQELLTAEARLSKIRSVRFNPVVDTQEIAGVEDCSIKHIVHKLYRAAKDEKIRYNPFQRDVEDAIKMANALKSKESIHIKVKCCLLMIIQEKYSSIRVTLTDDDICDIIKQKKQLEEQAIKYYKYKYYDYDPLSLEVAIATYHINQFSARFMIINPDEDIESNHKNVYTVIRFRMPGLGTDANYLRLREAVIDLTDYEIIAAVYKLKPVFSVAF